MLSFGPLMRFVVGTWYAAPALARSVAGRRQPVVRLSYKPRVVLRARPQLTATRPLPAGAVFHEAQ